MNGSLRALCLSVALCSLSSIASAASLTIVNVNGADIKCVFEADCTIPDTEGNSNFAVPGATGTGQLQMRSFTGKSGVPTTIKTGYEYRVDLSQATTFVDASCVTGLEIDFGPVTKLQYDKVGPLDDVFVINKNGPGAIGLFSAVQNGGVITFTFAQPVCAADGSSPGKSTFFFGLASTHPLTATTAKIEASGNLINVRAGAPSH